MAAVGGSSAATTLPSLRNSPSSTAFRRSSAPPPPQVYIFSKPSLSRARVSGRSPSLNLNPRYEIVSDNSVQKKGIGFKASTPSPLELLKSSAVDNMLTWSETLPTHSQPPGSAPRSHQISPIQSLVGQTGRRWLMGVISQLEDGHFYLEDLTASVEINLSNAQFKFPLSMDVSSSVSLTSNTR